MKVVNIHEAKTHFSRLVGRAHVGEEIIIAKAGKPYARLVPLSDRMEKRMPGIAKGAVTDAFFESLPEDELARWES
ncbi:MAG TPA: type II toxin-antitoxin system Phd/YefM family antitoxin [Gammaproteobacteria bacterium]|nr:type II toxin-antitoxin system Phd/YefM family antitoxin [Gammaproteobacteria bacterium]